MTWSYSGDPSTSTKDAVRLLIGDTIGIPTSMQLMQDEEIAYLLTAHGNDPLAAAVAALRSLASKFARYVDEVTGDLQRKYSQRVKQFLDLADKLLTDASNPLLATPIPFAGGISKSDIETRVENTDRYPDIFQIGEDDERNLPGGIGGRQPSNDIDLDALT